MHRCFLPLTLVSLVFAAHAATEVHTTGESQQIISEQFGSQFALLPDFPVLTGDFNGDGIEDVVFVATSHGGFQAESGQFRVVDPSSSYFGMGDPKITSQFSSKYPGGPRYLLIIHGSGKEAWRAKEPKERFVVINLAFDHLSVGHVKRKKKIFNDIGIEETGILNSFLYWNGRKYQWQPGASEL
ncbi:MAG TPA: hypothetical protein VG498_06330 [Terriglobales bacterium]|nr:hypothetical protein [Terriglobales bacterium]